AIEALIKDPNVKHIRYVYTDDESINNAQSSGYIHTIEGGRMITRIVTTTEAREHEKSESELAVQIRNKRIKDGKAGTDTHVTNEDTLEAHKILEAKQKA